MTEPTQDDEAQSPGEAQAQAQADQAEGQPQDGNQVDPRAESAGLPDKLEERLRAVGATDAEMAVMRENHANLPYYDRFLANQTAGQYGDDASVYALLENMRAAEQDGGIDGKAEARRLNAAVDSGDSVVTAPAPEGQHDGTALQAAIPAGAAQGTDPRTGQPVTPPGTTEPTDPETSGEQGPVTTTQQVEQENQATELELRTQVPTGTREQITSWVDQGESDSDKTLRAQAALYVEEHTDGEEPRKSLVTQLRKIVSGS